MFWYFLFALTILSCERKSNSEIEFYTSEIKNDSLSMFIEAVYFEDLNTVIELAKKNTNNKDYQEPKFGITPLIFAIKNKKYLSAKTLIKMGANPNKSGFDGETPLTCCFHNTFDSETKNFIRYLVEHNADVNKIESNKNVSKSLYETTPLILAIGDNNLEMTKYLIDNGAEINKGAYEGEYLPISEALLIGNIEMVELILKQKNFIMPSVVYKRINKIGEKVNTDFCFAIYEIKTKSKHEQKILKDIRDKYCSYK